MRVPAARTDLSERAWIDAVNACGLIHFAGKAWRRGQVWTARRRLDEARTNLARLAAAAEYGELDAKPIDRLSPAWHAVLRATVAREDEDIPDALIATARAVVQVSSTLEQGLNMEPLGHQVRVLERAVGVLLDT